MDTKPTPGPWTVRNSYVDGSLTHITSPTNDHIAIAGTPEDAAFIVRACNDREDLLAALKELLAASLTETLLRESAGRRANARDVAREAIARATEAKP